MYLDSFPLLHTCYKSLCNVRCCFPDSTPESVNMPEPCSIFQLQLQLQLKRGLLFEWWLKVACYLGDNVLCANTKSKKTQQLSTVIAQISLTLCSIAVCLQIHYVLQDLTTECNAMFGKSEPLSQKPIYFFTSDSIKFSWRKLHSSDVCCSQKLSVGFCLNVAGLCNGLSCKKLQQTNGRVLSKCVFAALSR